MRLATFNIRNGAAEDGPHAWPVRREGFLAALRRLDADVLCLQEVFEFQLDAILGALPDYRHVGVGRDDGLRSGEFVPILFRAAKLSDSGTFWLSSRPDEPGSIDWGARLPRICTWAELDGRIVANVHLDHESELARRNGLELIQRTLAADVICGDLNADVSETCVQSALAAGYQDLGADAGGTFNDFDPSPSTASRIDYVLVRPPVTGTAWVVREPLVSDHWPVVATCAGW